MDKELDKNARPLPSFKGGLAQFKHNASRTSLSSVSKRSTITSSTISSTKVIQPCAISKPPAKAKPSRGYVPPEHYAHLPQTIPILLRPNLLCAFIGYNPGIESARKGLHYAHRSNQFWSMLSQSGCVSRPCKTEDGPKLMDEYGYGFHDLVLRPTKGINELSSEELTANVPRLEGVLAQFKPRVVCFVGKGIYERVYRVKAGRPLPKSFEWGEQTELKGFAGGESRLFVLPSTSGLAAGVKRSEKLRLWHELAGILEEERKTWVQMKPEVENPHVDEVLKVDIQVKEETQKESHD